ncbi:MAG: Rab family GTPase [Promethearchaeota archaeon]
MFRYTFKILLLGDASVGKTTLTHRFIDGVFLDNPRLTIGVDFFSKKVLVPEEEGEMAARLQIWDFGGEERFRFLLPTYCKGANAALFLYDITNSKSLYHLPQWTKIVFQNTSAIPILLVGAKADLEEFRAVPTEEGIEAAKQNSLAGFVEVSSKTGQNVEECFNIITKILIQRSKESERALAEEESRDSGTDE